MAVTIAGSGQVIVQVIQVVKTDAYTTTVGTTPTTIPGMSVTITPTNASNRILVFANLSFAVGGSYAAQYINLQRNSTNIYIGDAAGSRTRATIGGFGAANDAYSALPFTMVYLDSPSTTSATTYSMVAGDADGSGNAFYVNRGITDTDSLNYPRTVSSITVMEISGT
jgi:hypothetical protein